MEPHRFASGVIVGGVILLAIAVAVGVYFLVKHNKASNVGKSRAQWAQPTYAFDELYGNPQQTNPAPQM